MIVITKYYCNHCGKELSSREVCELSSSNTFCDPCTNKSVWYGEHLCLECYRKRIYAHCDLDNKFLGSNK